MKVARKPTNITPRMILGYMARFGVCFLTMEFVLHYMYVIAIKDARAWANDSPFELSMIGYWNLIAVWLKVRIPLPDPPQFLKKKNFQNPREC